MPRLDLLAENYFDSFTIGRRLADDGNDRVENGLVHLCAKGTAVVEEELKSVLGTRHCGHSIIREGHLVPAEPWGNSHIGSRGCEELGGGFIGRREKTERVACRKGRLAEVVGTQELKAFVILKWQYYSFKSRKDDHRSLRTIQEL